MSKPQAFPRPLNNGGNNFKVKLFQESPDVLGTEPGSPGMCEAPNLQVRRSK